MLIARSGRVLVSGCCNGGQAGLQATQEGRVGDKEKTEEQVTGQGRSGESAVGQDWVRQVCERRQREID